MTFYDVSSCICLAVLTGVVGNHTGWVRALAAVEKTAEEAGSSAVAGGGGQWKGEGMGAGRARQILLARSSTRTLSLRILSEMASYDVLRIICQALRMGAAARGGQWRFSAACNFVRVWEDRGVDSAGSVGSVGSARSDALADVFSASIFTGDILALAAGAWEEEGALHRRLFCGVADGTVRGWEILSTPPQSSTTAAACGAAQPNMRPLGNAPKHAGRVSALLLHPPWQGGY